ncbi:MAG: hypothetical protein LBS82_02935 [Spirochaetaceae bacterium]|jgi:hypothetical protein|nr:hypothetical protein [Spirochaetaceae bacterium]
MDIETSFGYAPQDVSAEKCGYDVESLIPQELRGNAATSGNAGHCGVLVNGAEIILERG